MHLNETDQCALTQLHRRLRRGPESFNTFYWNQLGAVWFEKASHTANIKLRLVKRQRWPNILNEINWKLFWWKWQAWVDHVDDEDDDDDV